MSEAESMNAEIAFSARQFLHSIIFHVKSGRAIYAQAEGRGFRDMISLTFRTSMEPFPEMQGNISPFAQDENAHPNMNYIQYFGVLAGAEGTHSLIQYENQLVEKVLVNLTLTTPENQKWEQASWLSLIAGVAQVCRLSFPNMKGEESAFNVHDGKGHYRCDDQLCPNARMDQVVLKPK